MMYHLNLANTRRWTKRSKKQTNKKSKPFTVLLSSVKSRGLKVNKKTTDRLEKLFKSLLKSNKLGKSNHKKVVLLLFCLPLLLHSGYLLLSTLSRKLYTKQW